MSLQHSRRRDNQGKFPFHMRGATQGPTVYRCPQVYRHNPGLFFLKSMVSCSPTVSLQVAWRPQSWCSRLSSPFKESSFHWSPLQACFLWVRADPWVGSILFRAFLKDSISCGPGTSPSVSNWCHLEFLVFAQSKGSSQTEGEKKEVIWETPKQKYAEIPGSWAAHPNLGWFERSCWTHLLLLTVQSVSIRQLSRGTCDLYLIFRWFFFFILPLSNYCTLCTRSLSKVVCKFPSQLLSCILLPAWLGAWLSPKSGCDVKDAGKCVDRWIAHFVTTVLHPFVWVST